MRSLLRTAGDEWVKWLGVSGWSSYKNSSIGCKSGGGKMKKKKTGDPCYFWWWRWWWKRRWLKWNDELLKVKSRGTTVAANPGNQQQHKNTLKKCLLKVSWASSLRKTNANTKERITLWHPWKPHSKNNTPSKDSKFTQQKTCRLHQTKKFPQKNGKGKKIAAAVPNFSQPKSSKGKNNLLWTTQRHTRTQTNYRLKKKTKKNSPYSGVTANK